MGDHDTWYSVLPFWAELEASLSDGLKRDWTWVAFQATHFSLIHVASALIAAVFVLFVTLRWRASLNDDTQGVVPPEQWRLPAMLDSFVGATFQMASDVMGEEAAKRYLPFVGTLALFIFCMNIQGLIPGLLPGTSSLKTNLALSLIVFVAYNAIGLIRQGPHYLAHFLGPSFELGGIKLPWLAPLMLPVEIFSHLARPVSLALRLTGNLLADHKVVGAILLLLPWLVPVPFLLLGTLVCIVQTVVFTLLTMIYIGEALGHAEDHH